MEFVGAGLLGVVSKAFKERLMRDPMLDDMEDPTSMSRGPRLKRHPESDLCTP